MTFVGALDADRPKETLTYSIIDSSFGHIVSKINPNISLHSFTQDIIDKHQILFKHESMLKKIMQYQF